MANPCLVLCGGARLTARTHLWRRLEPLCLHLGPGRDGVHLRLNHLSRAMGARVSPAAVDLLEIASFVYAADQALSRGGQRRLDYGDRWHRQFRFEIPVRCPEIWRNLAMTAALAETLEFLSDDHFEFAFTRHPNPPPMQSYLFGDAEPDGREPYRAVTLLSGGMDSLGGAVQEILQAQQRIALVSHRPVSKIYARQQGLVKLIDGLLPDQRLRPLHVAVEVNKGRSLEGDFTQRTRSFLFASLAAVVARTLDLRRVRFYENGVLSFNLPLGLQVLGTRASRTTHPRVLAGFQRIFFAAVRRPV